MTTLETLRDCVYDAAREKFLVTQNLASRGRWTEILSVLVERDGSAFVVRQRSGKSFEVPWDFVLHHLEPGYPYFKGRLSQRRLEKDIAFRIGRRVRELRQEE